MRAAGPGFRAAAAAVSSGLALLAGLFAAQLQADYLHLWRYDAGTKRAYRLLVERAAREPGLRIGHDWIFEPGLNFYREAGGPGWLPAFGRDGPGGDFDVYYLEAGTARAWAEAGRIRVVYEDPVSGAVVGVPSRSGTSR
jgi:hypothetical protein